MSFHAKGYHNSSIIILIGISWWLITIATQAQPIQITLSKNKHAEQVRAGAFIDAYRYLSMDENKLVFWDTVTGEVIRTLEFKAEGDFYPSLVDFSLDLSKKFCALLLGYSNTQPNQLIVIDLQNHQIIHQVALTQEYLLISRIRLDIKNHCVYQWRSYDDQVWVIDLKKKKYKKGFKVPKDHTLANIWPNGQALLSYRDQKGIHWYSYDLKGNKTIHEIEGLINHDHIAPRQLGGKSYMLTTGFYKGENYFNLLDVATNQLIPVTPTRNIPNYSFPLSYDISENFVGIHYRAYDQEVYLALLSRYLDNGRALGYVKVNENYQGISLDRNEQIFTTILITDSVKFETTDANIFKVEDGQFFVNRTSHENEILLSKYGGADHYFSMDASKIIVWDIKNDSIHKTYNYKTPKAYFPQLVGFDVNTNKGLLAVMSQNTAPHIYIDLIDLETDKRLKQITLDKNFGSHKITLSESGKSIYYWNSSDESLLTIDIASEKIVRTKKAPSSMYLANVWSDGSGWYGNNLGIDNDAVLFSDKGKRLELAALEGGFYNKYVTRISKGKYLVRDKIGSEQTTYTLSVRSFTQELYPKVHFDLGPIIDLALSDSLICLLYRSGSNKPQLAVMDIEIGKVLKTLDVDPRVFALSFDLNKQLFTVSQDQNRLLFNKVSLGTLMKPGVEIQPRKGHQGEITHLMYSPNRDFLVSRGSEGRLRVMETKSYLDVLALENVSSSITVNDHYLAHKELFGVHIYDIHNPQYRWTLSPSITYDLHNEAISISPVTNHLALVQNKKVVLYDFLKDETYARLDTDKGDAYISSIRFSPSGKYLLVVKSNNNKVFTTIWDIQSRRRVKFRAWDYERLDQTLFANDSLIGFGGYSKKHDLTFWQWPNDEIFHWRDQWPIIFRGMTYADQHTYLIDYNKILKIKPGETTVSKVLEVDKPIEMVAVNPITRQLVYAVQNNISTLDLETLNTQQLTTQYVNSTIGVSFDHKGKVLWVGPSGQPPSGLNLRTGELIAPSFAQSFMMEPYTDDRQTRENSLDYNEKKNILGFVSNQEQVVFGSIAKDEIIGQRTGRSVLIDKTGKYAVVGHANKQELFLDENHDIDILHLDSLNKVWTIKGKSPFSLSENNETLLFRKDKNSISSMNMQTGLVKKLGETDLEKYKWGVQSLKMTLSDKIILAGHYPSFKAYNEDFSEIDLGWSSKAHLIQVVDSNSFVIARGSSLEAWNLKVKNPQAFLVGHKGKINDMDAYDSLVFSTSEDGFTKIWNLNTGQLVASVMIDNEGEHLIVTPDQYYLCSKYGNKNLVFKYNDKFYSFEQFDLQFNRPDIVLDRIGYATPEQIQMYHRLYQKRLLKLGFEEKMFNRDFHLPNIKIDKLDRLSGNQVNLVLSAWDQKYALKNINIWVNDVPVYGIRGYPITSDSLQMSFKVQLSSGRNRIQVSCLNVKGVESLRETLEVNNTTQTESKPDLYLITMSVSDYANDELDLTYARKDGEDIIKMFSEDQSNFNQVHTISLYDSLAVEDNFSAIKNTLLQSKVDDHVVMFISGHGVLNKDLDFFFASYDYDPQKNIDGIAYEQIENVLDSIPARKKLLLIDACHSGEVDPEEKSKLNVKHITPGDMNFRGVTKTFQRKSNLFVEREGKLGLTNSMILMEAMFADLSRSSGTIVISAAAGDNYAYEAKEWNNGVFTYAIKDGLTNRKADLNGDEVIKVSELKKYVYEMVVKYTNGEQQPTSRQENLIYDFRIW